MSSFYVIVTSNDAVNWFPENKSNQFKSLLNPDLNLVGGSWKVAVQTLICGKVQPTINSPLYQTNNHFLFFKKINGKRMHLPFKYVTVPNHITTSHELVQYLNQDLFFPLKRTKTMTFKANTLRGCIYFEGENIAIYVRPSVAEWIGLLNAKKCYFGSEEYDCIDLDNTLQTSTYNGPNYKIEKQMPSLINIKLHETTSDIGQRSKSKYIKTFDLVCEEAFDQKKHLMYFESKRKEFFPLLNSNLSSLSVEINDENDQPLSLSSVPTTIKLKFQNMDSSPPAFLLHCSSKESQHLFPQNKANEFTLELAYPIEFTKPTEVAMSSIFFPQGGMSFLHNLNDTSQYWLRVRQLDGTIHTYNFAKFEGTTEQHLFMQLNDGVLVHYPDNIKATMKKKKISFTMKNIAIRMSPALALILGAANWNNSKGFMEMRAEDESKQFIFTEKISLQRLIPPTICLIANFISHQHQGDRMNKVLKIIPLNSKCMGYESHHLDFAPIYPSLLQRMHFKLVDLHGKPIHFTNEQATTTLNLIFRNVQ